MSDNETNAASENQGQAATCAASPGHGCSAIVNVGAIAPFFRYAVGPTSAHSPAIPTYTLKGAEKLYEEFKRELPWAGVILFKRIGWGTLAAVREYKPNPSFQGIPNETTKGK